MPPRLFVYGTLLDEALVVQLTGRTFPRIPAVLAGYRREVPPGGYPRIVPAPQARVQGMLLDDVDAAALRAFDAYEDEGRLYRRVTVTVEADDRSLDAQTYVPFS